MTELKKGKTSPEARWRLRPTRVCVVGEELVALTGDGSQAFVLSQFLYWTARCHDFDEMLAEENARRQKSSQSPVNMPPFQGWISLMALETETMGVTQESLRRCVAALIEKGWIEALHPPKDAWDRTGQYRVNLVRLAQDLKELGYTVPGFTFESELPSELPSVFFQKPHSSNKAENKPFLEGSL